MGAISSHSRSRATTAGGLSGRCLLIQLDPVQLIIPRILVAEIIHNEGLDLSSSLNRNLRIFEWRGFQVPLLSPTIIHPRCDGISADDSKFAVLHGLFNRAKLPYYAIPLRKNPRITAVSNDNLVERVELHPQPADLLAVTVDGESAVIPRVEYLESYVIGNLYK